MNTLSSKDKALAAFLRRKQEIDTMLERLQAASANHFDCMPEEIHWGHVDNLEYYAELLKRITDAALQESELAAWATPGKTNTSS